MVEAIVHDDKGIGGSLRFDNIESDYNFILSSPQSITMQVLESSLEDRDTATYLHGREVIELGHTENGLHGMMRNTENEDTEHFECEWLIGCDGAHSTTRTLAGLDGKSERYRPKFVMGDYEDTSEFGNEAHLFFTESGSLESFPLPNGIRRWVALAGNSDMKDRDRAFLEKRVFRLSGVQIDGREVSPLFNFVPEKMSPARMISGRIVLAGDAAHFMSPIGGQGMNTGFADADFLSSIIPHLLKGDENRCAGLLHAYENVRIKASNSARRRAALSMWVGTRTGKQKSSLRSSLLRLILGCPSMTEKLSTHFSMLSIPPNPEIVLPSQEYA